MKRIRIHGADHMRAALTAARETGRAVVLISPIATQAGIGWWRRLMVQAAAEFPDVKFESMLDCGPSAGMALAAIRTKVGPLRVSVTPEILEKLSDIAQQAGVRAEGGGDHALDLLGMPDASRTCRDWLAAEDADTGA